MALNWEFLAIDYPDQWDLLSYSVNLLIRVDLFAMAFQAETSSGSSMGSHLTNTKIPNSLYKYKCSTR